MIHKPKDDGAVTFDPEIRKILFAPVKVEVTPRPRLFITPGELAELRQRTRKDSTFESHYARLKDEAGKDLASACLLALISREANDVAAAKSSLLSAAAQGASGNIYGSSDRFTSLCAGFDWLHGDLTAEERNSVGRAILDFVKIYDKRPKQPDWANQMYELRGGCLLAGIVLLGAGIDNNRAERLVREYATLLKQSFIPAQRLMNGTNGGMIDGTGYWYRTIGGYGRLLEAWRTYSGKNLFPLVCPQNTPKLVGGPCERFQWRNLPNLQSGDIWMVTTTKARKRTGSKGRFIGKPNGHIQERVQAVGPEHFYISKQGSLAVDASIYDNRNGHTGFGVAVELTKKTADVEFLHVLHCGSTPFSASLGIGDLNGDGRPDALIAFGERRPPRPTDGVYWYEAPRDPRMSQWIRRRLTDPALPIRWCMALTTGDVDNDGDLDVVALSFNRAIVYLAINPLRQRGEVRRECRPSPAWRGRRSAGYDDRAMFTIPSL